VNTLRKLAAALGAGFYRYWHVPAPSAFVDIRETRRADLSVIGPGALAILASGCWAAGRLGTSILLDERVTAPLDSLPWTARLLILTGMLGLVVAATWWVSTAPSRARVAAGVAEGSVVRIPDEASAATAPLHAAVSELGRTLRGVPGNPPLATPAFRVLRTAATALVVEDDGRAPEQRRLRRRCLQMAQRLSGGRAADRVEDHVAA
jgi:hypothetical protein